MRRSYSEEDVTAGLMAMVAWAGNASAACRYLKAEKQIDIPQPTLNSWKVLHAARYDELRDKHSEQMEAKLSHEYRDVANLAVQAERLAIARATERLEAGEDQDPARTAANLSRVAQSSTDKLMTLTARPVQITETRGTEEILRSLVAKGVLQLPKGTPDRAEEHGDLA